MPRQIIDVQSSQPRYVRRRALQAAVVVLVLAALVAILLYAVEHHRATALPAAQAGLSFQEPHGVNAEPGSPSLPRRTHAA